MNTVDYQIALSAFRAASSRFRKAETLYRSRQIGDATYLEELAEFKAAEKALDDVTPGQASAFDGSWSEGS